MDSEKSSLAYNLASYCAEIIMTNEVLLTYIVVEGVMSLWLITLWVFIVSSR